MKNTKSITGVPNTETEITTAHIAIVTRKTVEKAGTTGEIAKTEIESVNMVEGTTGEEEIEIVTMAEAEAENESIVIEKEKKGMGKKKIRTMNEEERSSR